MKVRITLALRWPTESRGGGRKEKRHTHFSVIVVLCSISIGRSDIYIEWFFFQTWGIVQRPSAHRITIVRRLFYPYLYVSPWHGNPSPRFLWCLSSLRKRNGSQHFAGKHNVTFTVWHISWRHNRPFALKCRLLINTSHRSPSVRVHNVAKSSKFRTQTAGRKKQTNVRLLNVDDEVTYHCYGVFNLHHNCTVTARALEVTPAEWSHTVNSDVILS